MNIKEIFMSFTLLITGVFSNGCTASPPTNSAEDKPVTVLLSSSFCGLQQESVHLINTQAQLTTLFESTSRSPSKTQQVPNIDFEQYAVLHLSVGVKPSAGYELRYNEAETIIRDGLAHIKVTSTSPAPNRMNAQVMTRPCLALKIEKRSIKKIELELNQKKQTLALDAS